MHQSAEGRAQGGGEAGIGVGGVGIRRVGRSRPARLTPPRVRPAKTMPDDQRDDRGDRPEREHLAPVDPEGVAQRHGQPGADGAADEEHRRVEAGDQMGAGGEVAFHHPGHADVADPDPGPGDQRAAEQRQEPGDQPEQDPGGEDRHRQRGEPTGAEAPGEPGHDEGEGAEAGQRQRGEEAGGGVGEVLGRLDVVEQGGEGDDRDPQVDGDEQEDEEGRGAPGGSQRARPGPRRRSGPWLARASCIGDRCVHAGQVAGIALFMLWRRCREVRAPPFRLNHPLAGADA